MRGSYERAPAISTEVRCGYGSHRSTGFRRRPAAERHRHDTRSDRGSSRSPWYSEVGCSSAQAANSHMKEQERTRCCSTGCCSPVPDSSRAMRHSRCLGTPPRSCRCPLRASVSERASTSLFLQAKTFPLLCHSVLLKTDNGLGSNRFLFTALAQPSLGRPVSAFFARI